MSVLENLTELQRKYLPFKQDELVPVIIPPAKVILDKDKYIFIREGFHNFDYTVLDKLIKKITSMELSQLDIAEALYELGNCLMDKKRNKIGDSKSKVFYEFCEEYFKYKPAYIRRMLRIHKKFAVDKEHPEYRQFTLAQLIEMLTIDSDKIGVITPEWTCRRIREYRKSISDYEEKSDVDEMILSDNEILHEDMKSILKSNIQEYDGYLKEVLNKLKASTKLIPGTNNYEVYMMAINDMYQYLITDFSE